MLLRVLRPHVVLNMKAQYNIWRLPRLRRMPITNFRQFPRMGTARTSANLSFHLSAQPERPMPSPASAARPALLIIDMQNDFVLEGAPMRVAQAAATVPVIAGLLAAFRARALPIAFTRYVATERYAHLAGRLPWLRLLRPPTQACVPGFERLYPGLEGPRDCAEMIDMLAPAPGEIVVDKPYFSAFHDTDLEARLRASGADRLVVTGTITEMCVEDSARHAVHFGWPVTLLSDAVSSDDPEAAAATLRAFARNYGEVMTSRDCLSRLPPPG